VARRNILVFKVLLRATVFTLTLFIVVKLVEIIVGESFVDSTVLYYSWLSTLLLTLSAFLALPEVRAIVYGYGKISNLKYYLSQLIIFLVVISIAIHLTEVFFELRLVDTRAIFWALCVALGVIFFSDIIIPEKRAFALEKLKLTPVKALKIPRYQYIECDNELKIKIRNGEALLLLNKNYRGMCIYGDSYFRVELPTFSSSKRIRGFLLVLAKEIKLPENLEELEEKEAEEYFKDSVEQIEKLNKVLDRIRELIDTGLDRRALAAKVEIDENEVKVFKLWRFCVIEDKQYRLKIVNIGGLRVSDVSWLIMSRDARRILMKHNDGLMMIKCSVRCCSSRR